MKQYLDVLYRQIDGVDLYLDLYLPANDHPPLIMWIHGGGWMEGDRKFSYLSYQVERGYALASIEYRLSGQATFPANIMDCKAALTYLRQKAGDYGYDANRIAVAGDSAGGHLSALMGTSAGHTDWEPEGADCTVQAVVDFYGPTVLTRDWKDAQLPDTPESRMIGATVGTKTGKARAALVSPITYIDGTEPPFLILHGDVDPVVPFTQSIYLRDALESVGDVVAMHRVFGGGHGFDSETYRAVVDYFLDHHLKA